MNFCRQYWMAIGMKKALFFGDNEWLKVEIIVPDGVKIVLGAIKTEGVVLLPHGEHMPVRDTAPRGFVAGQKNRLPAESLPAVKCLGKVEAAICGAKPDHRFLPSVFVVSVGSRLVMYAMERSIASRELPQSPPALR